MLNIDCEKFQRKKSPIWVHFTVEDDTKVAYVKVVSRRDRTIKAFNITNVVNYLRRKHSCMILFTLLPIYNYQTETNYITSAIGIRFNWNFNISYWSIGKVLYRYSTNNKYCYC